MSKVSLRGVTARFGAVTALHPLDLDIAQGEFLTLLGPSGCGKTTTLRLIAGFLRPRAGRILFDDEDVSDTPPNRRRIGMVFQDYALFPHMTIAENIGFGLRERHVATPEIRRRVNELLEMIHLPDLGQRFPGELSGGQRQRVALARAVAHPPRVLLMDEPLGALDLKLREAMQGEIQRIQRRLGITTVFVTHDQSEAMSMSDRIVVMNHGRVEQAGSARDLYDHPVSRFVADFLGRINMLPVMVREAGSDGASLEFIGNTLRQDTSAIRAAGPATLAIRPEHFHLLSPGPTPTAINALPGRVIGIQFLGNLVRCEIELNGGIGVTVETIPNDPLAVPGREVWVAWDPVHGALFDPEPAVGPSEEEPPHANAI
jgi:spermidine/putrescine ABC transporter ATP-binding subunit